MIGAFKASRATSHQVLPSGDFGAVKLSESGGYRGRWAVRGSERVDLNLRLRKTQAGSERPDFPMVPSGYSRGTPMFFDPGDYLVPTAAAEPTKRQLGAARQRALLCRCMVQLAAEQGYESASVQKAVRLSGLGKGTFYSLFERGEACLLEAFERCAETIPPFPRASDGRSGSPEQTSVFLNCRQGRRPCFSCQARRSPLNTAETGRRARRGGRRACRAASRRRRRRGRGQRAGPAPGPARPGRGARRAAGSALRRP